MTGELQPLDLQFPIVDAQGRPTQYFIRWAQQRQIDIDDSITLGDLEAFLTAHKLAAGHGIILTPDGDINNSPNVSIANGTGLNFDVMGNLKLADTAVAPGTYGDATHVPAIVVDQQGRITGVTLVAISGGGGGGGAGTPPTIVQTGFINGAAGTGVTLAVAPTIGNLLIAMGTFPAATVGAGWTTLVGSTSGTQWSFINYKIAGAGEPVLQTPGAAAGASAVVIYELHGAAVSPFLYGFTAPAATSIFASTIAAPGITNALALGALSGDGVAANFTAFKNMTQDVNSPGGSRGIVAGHSNGSSPLAQILAILSASVPTRNCLVLVTA